MVQGTGSGAGKSTLVTALCRLFFHAGYSVSPFKSQNMSLNAAVTADGGEIGRAQAAQAEAAGLEPSVDMNPILLKPEGDGSQVIVLGRVAGRMTFRIYQRHRPRLLRVVKESLERLRAAHDVVIIEGAGSPAEVNLLKHEIANMAVAALADAPVLLVGDIDRGGVFASFVGTLDLLPPTDRARIRGFVINKFRGDVALLRPGLRFLEEKTGIPVLGVVPYLEPGLLPAEDSLDLDQPRPRGTRRAVEIAVVRLPHIANFDDFEPLQRELGVNVSFVTGSADIQSADLVIIPGTKCTVVDLEFLRARGLADAIVERGRNGLPVLGVCGGYQMLGTELLDPAGVESLAPHTPGLGLLPVVTRFTRPKRTEQVRARVRTGAPLFGGAAGDTFAAYEIHVGRTESCGSHAPFEVIERGGRPSVEADGCVNTGGTIVGTYLHGLLSHGQVRAALLSDLARRVGRRVDPRWGQVPERNPYDRLADLVGAALNLERIGALVGLPLPSRAGRVRRTGRQPTSVVPAGRSDRS
jgi:adenosylcobyric acid synthase